MATTSGKVALANIGEGLVEGEVAQESRSWIDGGV